LRSYLINLKPGKIVLWCYLIWYLVLATRYFDPSPAIWLNALGISAIIGTSLFLGIRSPGRQPERWQVFRLFLTPFCVSSFSALIKGKGFILIFPPGLTDLTMAAGACLTFVLLVTIVKILGAPQTAKTSATRPV
jgi:Na+/H+-dicarboxylate symporter